MSSVCGCLFGRNQDQDTYSEGEANHEEAATHKTDELKIIEPDTSTPIAQGSHSKKRKPKNGGSRSISSFNLTKTKSLYTGLIPQVPCWADKLRPELREKIADWIISFYHLDPRYQILKFFNLVAKQGADNMLDDMSDNDNTSDQQFYEEGEELLDESDLGDPLSGLSNRRTSTKTLNFLNHIFNTTSILTVWRPTSNEAMRKMMIGEGVGKGLNIKGKSAKQGKLSAFIPFMQIHNEADKAHVSKISRSALLRIYYSNKEFRQTAIDTLTKADGKAVEEKDEESSGNLYAGIKLLDDFIDKDMYGLEVQQVKFWKVYVLDQDITRDKDTETGRPSTAGFQDGNLKTLKEACASTKNQDQFPVLMQLSEDNPMSPQYLVMAYEENNTVKPVVSDFDGFLMGWRREALWFGCTLPRDQEALMLWSIEQTQRILEEPGEDSWTIRWLNVLKEEATGGNPNIPMTPKYGFGDPKSYSIMEAAAKKLLDSGAVRHGSECFNYGFPQEIDDHFLLISDTLKPVPWKYVTTPELQEILIQRIKGGFVFPLNPKWILCDPGWKKVYDALLQSSALYADMSLDVWFPRYSGIRKKIDALHKQYPDGFQREPKTEEDNGTRRNSFRTSLQQSSLSGQAIGELAMLELENFESRNKTDEDPVSNKVLKKTLHSVMEDDQEKEESV